MICQCPADLFTSMLAHHLNLYIKTTLLFLHREVLPAPRPLHHCWQLSCVHLPDCDVLTLDNTLLWSCEVGFCGVCSGRSQTRTVRCNFSEWAFINSWGISWWNCIKYIIITSTITTNRMMKLWDNIWHSNHKLYYIFFFAATQIVFRKRFW